jgi:hypothetical protein
MSRSRTLLAMSMSSVYQPNGHDLTTDCIRFARRKQQRRDLRAEIMLAAANRSPFPTATVLAYLPQRSPKMQPVAHDESLRAAMNKAKMRGGVSSIATTPQKFLNSGLRLRVLGHGMPLCQGALWIATHRLFCRCRSFCRGGIRHLSRQQPARVCPSARPSDPEPRYRHCR